MIFLGLLLLANWFFAIRAAVQREPMLAGFHLLVVFFLACGMLAEWLKDDAAD